MKETFLNQLQTLTIRDERFPRDERIIQAISEGCKELAWLASLEEYAKKNGFIMRNRVAEFVTKTFNVQLRWNEKKKRFEALYTQLAFAEDSNIEPMFIKEHGKTPKRAIRSMMWVLGASPFHDYANSRKLTGIEALNAINEAAKAKAETSDE